MSLKTLTNFTNKISKAINSATYRSINKASAKTNTLFKREVRKDTGLPTKAISKRFKVFRASPSKLKGGVSMGTKYGIGLENFKPKVKIIKGKNKRKYRGVTVKIGKEARSLVNGAFLATMKSGKSLVMARSTKARSPIKNVKHFLYESSSAHREELKAYAQEEYKKQFNGQLKYEMNK